MKFDIQILLIIVIASIIGGSFSGMLVLAGEITLNNQTKQECQQYAIQNHGLEVGIARYDHEKQFIDNYPWYQACIQNIEKPVQ